MATRKAMRMSWLVLLGVVCCAPGVGGEEPPQPRVQVIAAPRKGITSFTCLEQKLCVARAADSWWVGTWGGLVRLNETTLAVQRVYTPADGLAGTPVLALATVGNALWVATTEGISRLDLKSGEIRSVYAGQYQWRLERDEPKKQVWALSGPMAIRFDEAMDKTWAFQLSERFASVAREGDTLWAIGHEKRQKYPLTRLDTTTGATKTESVDLGDSYHLAKFIVGPHDLWCLTSIRRPHGGYRLFRIDKETWATRAEGTATGLARDDVQDVLVVGDDVWASTGAGPCRYDSSNRRWEVIPTVTSAKHDGVTWLGCLNGDLWMAARGYDTMRKMVTAWSMVPIEGMVPELKTLTLNRFDAKEKRWQSYSMAPLTNYDRIIAAALDGKRLWFLLDQRPVAQSSSELFSIRNKQRMIPGCVNLDLPGSAPVLSESCHIPSPDMNLKWRGRKPVELTIEGGTAWVRESDRLWRLTQRGQAEPLSLAGSLPDSQRIRLFAVDGRVFASCTSALLCLDPDKQQWADVKWPKVWTVSSIHKDCKGVWWLSAVTGRVDLPADPARNEEDQKPLQGGLFRSKDATKWEVPSLAPWTWHQAGLDGNVEFLAVEGVRRTPGDTPLWGRAAYEGPRPGVRQVRQTKAGEGVTCVESDGQRVWVGTLGDGVFCLENSRWRRLWPKAPSPSDHRSNSYPCAKEDTITSMALDGDWLWIATMADLRRYRLSTGVSEEVADEVVAFETPEHVGISGMYPETLMQYGPMVARAGGRVWFSSPNGQLCCLDPQRQTWKVVKADARGTCFAAVKDTLWVGTDKGLLSCRMNTGQWKRWTTADGLSGNHVTGVAVDDHFLWIGTNMGITRVEKGLAETW